MGATHEGTQGSGEAARVRSLWNEPSHDSPTGFELVETAVIDEDGYFLPGVDHEVENLSPLELANHMQKLAGRFKAELVEDHFGAFPAFGVSAAAIGRCQDCGRTLISAVHHEANHRLGHCGKCAPFNAKGRVDHQEWLRHRRGLA